SARNGCSGRIARSSFALFQSASWQLALFFRVVLISSLAGSHSFAAVIITNATGGTNLSPDTAANATSPTWTTLGLIAIREGNRTDISSSGGTLVLKAPAGFEYNTSALPNITFTAGIDIVSASRVFSNSTTFAITLTMSGTGGTDLLTIGNTNGLQVRPIAGTPLASGQIFRPTGTAGGTIVISGIGTTTNVS